MFKLFKHKHEQPRHEHDWELVAVNDKFHTTFNDTGKTKYWSMRFYKCACGERKYSDDKTNFYTHEGMDKCKSNWIDVGVVPLDSYHPADSKHFVKIDDTPKEQLDPLEQLNKTVEELCLTMLVIKRDFDLESKYPDLKAAADRYHLVLEQYRVMEILKGEKELQNG